MYRYWCYICWHRSCIFRYWCVYIDTGVVYIDTGVDIVDIGVLDTSVVYDGAIDVGINIIFNKLIIKTLYFNINNDIININIIDIIDIISIDIIILNKENYFYLNI